MGGGAGGMGGAAAQTCTPGAGQNQQPYNCIVSGHDCTQFHNCCQNGFTCVRKNQFYAGCLNFANGDTCIPGQNRASDPPQFQTPWECTYLGGFCTAPAVAASVQSMGMSENLFAMNGNLVAAMTESGGMDPQMKAFQSLAATMDPISAAQIVGVDPAMAGQMMPPAGGAPMTPPMAPVAPPMAPVAPPVAPVARPPVATPPAAVSAAYKAGSLLLPVIALLR